MILDERNRHVNVAPKIVEFRRLFAPPRPRRETAHLLSHSCSGTQFEMTFSPSGTQYELEGSDYSAVVTGIGASLRRLRFRGRDLVVPFGPRELRPNYRGAILAPWPNRVVDGRYSFQGTDHQLPLTEPVRGHALHGLALWLDGMAVDRRPSRVALAMVIEPQSGYPFRVGLVVTYELDGMGLHVNVTATNLSDRDAPFATAPHPYLVAPEGDLDEWTLSLPAAKVLAVTPDRLIPVDLQPVERLNGGVFDFREPREVGSTKIDHAFTDLSRDGLGMAAVTLTDRFNRGVKMSWGATSPWVQIHTADLPDPRKNRLGLAVEPMTGPPDAFNSGLDVPRISPGEIFNVEWTITAIDPSL
jgi:aldose 1-epimerase